MRFLVTISFWDVLGLGFIALVLLVLLVIWGLSKLERAWRWIKKRLGRKI